MKRAWLVLLAAALSGEALGQNQFSNFSQQGANQQAANQQGANQQAVQNQQFEDEQFAQDEEIGNQQGNFGQQGNANQQGNFNQQGGNNNNANNNANEVNGEIQEALNQNAPANQFAPINQSAPLNQVPLNQAAPLNPAANLAPAPAPAPDQAAQPAGPAAPSIPCKPLCRMKFQFDHAGTPSIHSFLLHWDFADGNLKYIEVLVSDTQEVIQRIQIPQDKTRLIYNELTEKPGRIKDKFIDSEDYNFDKFGDLRLVQQWPYKVGQKYYFVWLFDEVQNQYVLNAAITALQNPRPNPKTKRIEAVDLGGWGGGEYVQRSYSVNVSGRIRVMSKVTQTMFDPRRLWFQRDVRVRIAGDLQRICKIVVPTEGRPRKTWGNKALCRKYMTKETPKR